MALPRLLAFTDLTLHAEQAVVARFEALAELASPGSVALVLRDHQATAGARLRLGEALRTVARRAGQQFWVADRLDLALTLEADGLHLGERSVTARDARGLFGSHLPLSRAWHGATLGSAEAELWGVDALVLSPVLAARKGRPALGTQALGALRSELERASLPRALYALGGVDAEAAPRCLGAGAWGVAAIGAVLGGEPAPLLAALGIAR